MQDRSAAPPPPVNEAALGAASAGLGYLLWGLSVIFYKQLMDVPPFEVLAHRSVWSVVLTLLLIFALSRRAALMAVLRDRRTMWTLLGTSLLIGSNWFVFIYSINEARIVETSLGYYINPLVSVLLGVAFLGERLSRTHPLHPPLAAAIERHYPLRNAPAAGSLPTGQEVRGEHEHYAEAKFFHFGSISGSYSLP